MLKYAFGANLPLEVDVVLMITRDAPASQPGRETKLRTQVINNFTTSLLSHWSRAFGSEVVQSRKVVQKKIRRLVNSYFTEYVMPSRSKKRSNELSSKTKRQLFRIWAEKHMILFDLLKTHVNPDDFDDDERLFYHNQKSNRSGALSGQIDEQLTNPLLRPDETDTPSFVEECQEDMDENSEIDCDEAIERMEIDLPPTVDPVSPSRNRSGLAREVIEAQSSHCITNIPFECPRPEIRRQRLLTERIKVACARVAVGAQCSAMYARRAVQIVAKELYGHDYYLTPEEQMLKEPDIVHEFEVKSGDKVVNEDGSLHKVPHSSQEWKRFRYVLPSEKTINRYIGLMAAQEEAEAGTALLTMPADVKSTIHYDATTRSCIDGDWVSITLAFSNDAEYDLRPIFMGSEDRENIVTYLQETFKRLALATSIEREEVVTEKMLWEKVTFIATDSVSKNHFIGEGVAKRLLSDHVPIHVLCKSHTVEGLDRASLKVLTNYLEVPLNLRQELEKSNPSLRSFFRNTTIVQAGITALLKIVTPDNSANSCSLSIPFEKLCIEHGWDRKLTLYKERRFCKLGSCANAIIQALPILEQLLEETPADNLLAQACRLYLKCEVFITELRLLAYFNYHVVFPFLHAVEKVTTPELKRILPQLYQDLLQGKVNTLEAYAVKSKIGNVEKLYGELEMKILSKLTKAAADCIQLQCGREFGFAADSNEELRAADLTKIPDEKLTFAPTNNLLAERKLSVFSRRSRTAICKNSRHTGELLRDNMVLHGAQRKDLSKQASKIHQQLAEMNLEWYTAQKEVQKQAIERRMSAKKKNIDYVRKLAQTCKKWGGPCCSVEELKEVLKKNVHIDKKIVKTELSFYVHTHKGDRANRPELFKLVNIDMATQLENLTILLSDDDNIASQSSVDEISLPSNDDALRVLSKDSLRLTNNIFEKNKMCVSVWREGNDITWYVGRFNSIKDDQTFVVEHLVRVKKGSDLIWTNPSSSILEDVEIDQILFQKNGNLFEVKGHWTYERKNKFTLKNKDDIAKAFHSFASSFK